MGVQSIDGVMYRVRIKWRLHGQDCLNVLNFIGRGSQDLQLNLLQVILDCAVNNLLPVLSNECTLIGADVKAVTGSVAQEDEITLASGNVGTESVDSLPSFNALVCNLKTAHPGRTGRGKMYLLGIPEDRQETSVVDATFLAAAVAYIACIVSAFVNSDPLAAPFFHWAVFSKKDNQFYAVTSAAPNPKIASLRSRKIH